MTDGTVWLTLLPLCFSRSRNDLQKVEKQIVKKDAALDDLQQKIEEAEEKLEQVHVRYSICEMRS